MRRRVVVAGGFAVGMCLLGFFLRREGLTWAAAAGGLLAAGSVGWGLAAAPRPLRLLGVQPLPPRHIGWLAVCMAVGVGLALWYRAAQGRSLAPGTLTGFALAAAGIGLAEEVGYRGFLQGCVRSWGPLAAAATAAAAHTLYKCSLFVWRGEACQTQLLYLAAGTLVVGTAFGLMREGLGGLFFPAAAHVGFDLWAYGDLSAAPWWV
jgi:membrane protease YdiL (CAAX protease family)